VGVSAERQISSVRSKYRYVVGRGTNHFRGGGVCFSDLYMDPASSVADPIYILDADPDLNFHFDTPPIRILLKFKACLYFIGTYSTDVIGVGFFIVLSRICKDFQEIYV
jgi:hypothetical protein